MPLTSRNVWAKPVSENNRRSVLRGPGGLLAQLEDPRPQVRRWAVRDLSQYVEAIKPLLACLHGEMDPGVRESIFTGLLSLGGEKVAKEMVLLLKSDDPSLRNGAVEVLMEMADHTPKVIPGLLRETDALLRLYGVELLRRLKSPQAVEWLRPLLHKEYNDSVVAAMAMCIIELSLQPLAEELRSRENLSDFVSFALQRVFDHFSVEKG